MEEEKSDKEVEDDRAQKFRDDYNRAADEAAGDLHEEQSRQNDRLDELEKD